MQYTVRFWYRTKIVVFRESCDDIVLLLISFVSFLQLCGHDFELSVCPKFFFTARRYASVVHAVVVCPSVCLSRRYCSKTAKPAKCMITETPYSSPGTLFF